MENRVIISDPCGFKSIWACGSRICGRHRDAGIGEAWDDDGIRRTGILRVPTAERDARRALMEFAKKAINF
jgi:hypothetical protein